MIKLKTLLTEQEENLWKGTTAGEKAENLLKSMGAKTWYANQFEPPFYKLQNEDAVLNIDGQPAYDMSFGSDGTVNIQTLGGVSNDYTFKLNNNRIEIYGKSGKYGTVFKNKTGRAQFYNEAPAETKPVTTTDTTSTKPEAPDNTQSTATPKPDAADAERSWIDIVQTVGDWAGFIPGVGDGIDLINGLVYLARGKYLDAALSAIAVIPFAGSAIKQGVKTAPDLLKLLQKSIFDPAAAKAFWIGVVSKGLISPKILLKVSDGMSDSIKWLTTNRKSITKSVQDNFGVSQLDKIDNAIDVFLSWLKESKKSIDDVAGSITPLHTPRSPNAVFNLIKNPNFFTKLWNAGFFDPKSLTALANLLKRRFVNIYKQDPIKLYGLVKLAGNNVDEYLNIITKSVASQKNNIINIVKGTNPKLFSDRPELIKEELEKIGLTVTAGFKQHPYLERVKNFEVDNISITSIDGLKKFAAFLSNKSDKFTTLINNIGTNSAELANQTGHIVWKSYSAENLKNLGNLLVSGALGETGTFIWKTFLSRMWELVKNSKKWVDIVGDEASYLADWFKDMPAAEREQGGWITPLLVSGIEKTDPTFVGVVKGTANQAINFFTKTTGTGDDKLTNIPFKNDSTDNK